MPKQFGVTLPLTGYIYLEVEAEDEQDAIEKAMSSDQVKIDNIEEWEACRQIVEGNVFHGLRNTAEAEDIDSGDDSNDDDAERDDNLRDHYAGPDEDSDAY